MAREHVEVAKDVIRKQRVLPKKPVPECFKDPDWRRLQDRLIDMTAEMTLEENREVAQWFKKTSVRRTCLADGSVDVLAPEMKDD